MVLGNKAIKELNLIKPFVDENCSPASYDLRVGEISGNLDDKLDPGECILIATKERVELPDNIAAMVKTRSSLARLGVNGGDIGGWVDPGFKGNLTLFVKNLGKRPIELDTLDRFAQIVFFEVKDSTTSYDGNYQDSNGVVESVL